LSLPPLRDRLDDIPPLVDAIISKAERRLGKQIRTIPKEVMEQLMAYKWPGNVRELENVIERAVIFSESNSLKWAAPLKNPQPVKTPEPHESQFQSLFEMEKPHILTALEKTNWNVTGKGGAADLLNLPPSTLRGRMRKHGIQRPS
jgi:transcriptional regulator with PAS, ATPase and Fis domain